MRVYIIRRLLLVIPTVFLVSVIIFVLIRQIPGTPADAIQAMMSDVAVDREAIERSLGLHDPIYVQYARWMGVFPHEDGRYRGIFQGDFGQSWWRGVPVLKLLAEKWPVTFQLGIMALLIAQLIALPIGIYSALRQDEWGDYLGRSFAILCISIPGFWLGTLIIIFPSIWWGYMPPIMLIRFAKDPIGNLRMFIIPATVLGMGMAGGTMRMTRTTMLEVLRQDYIRTAWAKGLGERVVTLRHALKNAFIPVVTIIGLQLVVMIGGMVIIEQIFNLPGIGRLIITALRQRDYPLISGTLLIFSIALMIINLAVDLIYAYLDPRIHYD
jgi:peptide/nickel transport system permease protein